MAIVRTLIKGLKDFYDFCPPAHADFPNFAEFESLQQMLRTDENARGWQSRCYPGGY